VHHRKVENATRARRLCTSERKRAMMLIRSLEDSLAPATKASDF
jgi:hypothetical protein